jgi:LacI family transcriptional regulator
VKLPDAYLREQSTTVAGGRAACAALLQLREPPTAIVCCIDYQAVGAMIEAQASGLTVPAQMSVVGIDNMELGEHLVPALTTVLVPTASIGERAALQIIGRISKLKMPRVELLSIELVVRKSTAPLGRN